MNYCPGCGYKLNEDTRFCPNCGRRLVAYHNNEEIERNPRVNISMERTKEDEVVRCPNCGSTLKYMSLYCEFCGSELNKTHNPYSIKLFSEKVSRLHSARARSKTNVLTSAFGFGKKDPAEEELISLITDFQIPNTVGDITEFMIFASSNINPATFDQMTGMNQTGAKSLYEFNIMQRESNAWLIKLKQAYNKASILFGNSSDFDKIDEIYQNTIKDVDKHGKRGRRYLFGLVIGASIFLLLMIILLFFNVIGGTEKKSDYQEPTQNEKIEKNSYSSDIRKIDVDLDALGVDYIYPQADLDSPLATDITVPPEIIYNTLASENKLAYTPYIITGKVLETFENSMEAYHYFGIIPEGNTESIDYFSFIVENEYGKMWIIDMATADVEYLTNQMEAGNVDQDTWYEEYVNGFGGYRKYEYPKKGENVAILGFYIGYSQIESIAVSYFGLNKMFYDVCLERKK